MPEIGQKPELDRETLAKQGIEIVESGDAEFPPHVELFKEGLLDHDISFTPDYLKLLKDDGYTSAELHGIPLSVYMKGPKSTSGKDTREEVNLRRARGIVKDAAGLCRNSAPESDWNELLKKWLFEEDDTRDLQLEIDFARATDTLWDEAHRLARTYQDLTITPKPPKPDIYLGFPIHLVDEYPCKGFRRHSYVQNFGSSILKRLLKRRLVCSPTAVFRNFQEGNESSIPLRHRVCFPWAIVETKHHNVLPSQKDYCECQGANGASVALSMLECLCKAYHNSSYSGDQVPPIAVFTFNGPETKLWVAYSIPYDKNTTHRMVCIWKGSINTFWGALQLCHIVDNLLFWGSRILKPQISMFIHEWLREEERANERTLKFKDDLELVEVVDRVHKRVERLSYFPQLQSMNSDSLITTIVMFQELLAGYKGDTTGSRPNLTNRSSVDAESVKDLPTVRVESVTNKFDPLLINSDEKAKPATLQANIYTRGRSHSNSDLEIGPVPKTFLGADFPERQRSVHQRASSSSGVYGTKIVKVRLPYNDQRIPKPSIGQSTLFFGLSKQPTTKRSPGMGFTFGSSKQPSLGKLPLDAFTTHSDVKFGESVASPGYEEKPKGFLNPQTPSLSFIIKPNLVEQSGLNIRSDTSASHNTCETSEDLGTPTPSNTGTASTENPKSGPGNASSKKYVGLSEGGESDKDGEIQQCKG